MHWLQFLLATLLASLPASGSSQTSATPTAYDIQFEIVRNGQLYARPKLTMRDNATAIMTVTEGHGYSMRVQFGHSPENGARFRIASEIFFAMDGRWVRQGHPVLIAPLNGRARIDIPRQGGSTTSEPFSVTATLTPRYEVSLLETNGRACTDASEAGWVEAMAQPLLHRASFQPTVDTPEGPPCCQGACFTCCGSQVCCCEQHRCNSCCCNR